MPESYDKFKQDEIVITVTVLVDLPWQLESCISSLILKLATTEQDPWHPQNVNYLGHANRSDNLKGEERPFAKELFFNVY